MRFVQTTLDKHCILDIDTIASIVSYESKNPDYNSHIAFYTPHGQNVAKWSFSFKEISLMKETLENLKEFINCVDINSIIKL